MRADQRFATLAEVRAERERLRTERALHAERLRRRWDELRHTDSRRRMFVGSLRALFPADAAGWREVLAEGGRIANAAVQERMRGSRHKLFWTGVTLALPWVAGQLLEPGRLARIVDEAGTTLERIRERFSRRS